MGLFDSIKAFVSKIVDNPVKVGIIAFLIYKIFKGNTAMENLKQISKMRKEIIKLSESITVVGKKNGKQLIYDDKREQWAVFDGNSIRWFTSETTARKSYEGAGRKLKMAEEKISKRIHSLKEKLALLDNDDRWKCPKCGIVDNDVEDKACYNCGYKPTLREKLDKIVIKNIDDVETAQVVLYKQGIPTKIMGSKKNELVLDSISKIDAYDILDKNKIEYEKIRTTKEQILPLNSKVAWKTGTGNSELDPKVQHVGTIIAIKDGIVSVKELDGNLYNVPVSELEPYVEFLRRRLQYIHESMVVK